MWKKINDIVCKFVGSYEAASSQKSSGQNENDVMKLAHQIHFNDHKSKFTLEHAWRELRHDRKWCQNENEGSGMSKTGKTEDESTARPPGVKASKAKKNVTNATSVSGESLLEYQNMWEIKEKDFIRKEKLSKYRMLENLLAKTEPLDDIEMTLKKKLISDMFS